jgi:hypothetical protein
MRCHHGFCRGDIHKCLVCRKDSHLNHVRLTMKDTATAKLPDPFQNADGTRANTPEEWNRKRNQIEALVVGLEYGGLPPKPECFHFETCNAGKAPQVHTIAITAGTLSKQLTFELRLFIPEREGPLPVVLTGDGCYRFMNDEVVAEINARGCIAASFDRTMLVRNVYTEPEAKDSPLYRVYPGIESGSLAGWAWGYHRCIDVLMQLPFVDKENIAVTGHSRGGKTALLASATDSRIAFAAPNGSGGGGTASWRYRMEGYNGPEYEDPHSETLAGMLDVVPHWFGPQFREYCDRENELPFDQHFLEVLVAPRYLLHTEGFGDIWSNPKGSYQTLMAAREVYQLLGASDHIVSRFRPGFHWHKPEDFRALLDVMESKITGKPLPKTFYENPFQDMPPVFDWRCPVNQK